MTELLAPGVYTIETSFRARSIQGVGTSTTGFVGLARTGPVGGPPMLVTSYAEFERMYGGMSDLAAEGIAADRTVNFLAHAVRAFFGEQGARLYISRAYAPTAAHDGHSQATLLEGGGLLIRLRSRFPGAGSNGRLTVSEAVSPATDPVLARAPVGTMARTRGTTATAARISTLTAPGALPNGAGLMLTVNGAAPVSITLPATAAVVTAPVAYDPATDVPAGSTLIVVVDGLRQVISLPAGVMTANDMRDALAAAIRNATVTLVAGALVISSTARGAAISVQVERQDLLGFVAADTASGTGIARQDAVTPGDIDARLAVAGVAGVRAVAGPNGTLMLESTLTGAGQTLSLAGSDAATLAAMGFGVGAALDGAGTAGVERVYFIRATAATVGWHRFARNAMTDRWETDLVLVDAATLLADTDYIVTVSFRWENADGAAVSYDEMSLVSTHPRYIGNRMRVAAPGADQPTSDPLTLTTTGNPNGAELHARLFAAAPVSALDILAQDIALVGGNDGSLPAETVWAAALDALNRYDDIAIVAAPGSSAYPLVQRAMRALLAAHAEASNFRIAVIDPQPGLEMDGLRNERAETDSTYAAFYAPWIRVSNPLARPGNEFIPREILVPPSGHVAGIYARNDQLRGVHKTPANELIRSAIGFETEYNQAQQGVLNPLGINCLRTLKGRGARVYGGRLATSDREVVYVSDRRYLNFIKRSIYESMQWAVFEPNGPALWSNVREAVASFLYNQWFNGALFGMTTDEAYFVVCDGSVMTQADLDNGRMICEIGLALLKPAEFVVFRIGQKTADARR